MCVCVFLRVSLCVFMFFCLGVRMRVVCMYVFGYACMCVHVFVYVRWCVYLRMCKCAVVQE